MPIFTNVLIPGWLPSSIFDDEEDLLAIELPEATLLEEDLECVCEMNTLLGKGCRCGAMQRELDQNQGHSS
jgi:hypothetical protein